MLSFVKLSLKKFKTAEASPGFKDKHIWQHFFLKSATTLYTHFPSVSFYQCLHKIKLGGNKNPSGEYLKLFLR